MPDSEDNFTDLEMPRNETADTIAHTISGYDSYSPNAVTAAQIGATNPAPRSPALPSTSSVDKRYGPMSAEKKKVKAERAKQAKERNASVKQELTQANKDKKALQIQLKQTTTELQVLKERLEECQEATALAQNTANDRERRILELENRQLACDVSKEPESEAKKVRDLYLRIWIDAVKLSTAEINLKKHVEERKAIQGALDKSQSDTNKWRMKYLMAEKTIREKKWGALRGCDHDDTALHTLQEDHALEIAQKVHELSQCQHELFQCQQELSATRASLSDSRESLRAHEEKFASSSSEKGQLEDEVADLKEQLNDSMQEADASREEAQASSHSLAVLKDANRNLELDLDSATSEISTLRQQISETSSHLHATQTELSSCQRQASASNAAHQSALFQRDSLLADQARQIEDLSTEVAELRAAAAAAPKTPTTAAAAAFPPLSSPPESTLGSSRSSSSTLNSPPSKPEPLALSAFPMSMFGSTSDTEAVSSAIKDPRLKSIRFCGPTLEFERE